MHTKTSTSWYDVTHDDEPKNSYSKQTTKLLLFRILWHNLSKFITQMGLYCSKQLEATFHITTTTTQPSYGPFSRTTQVSRCQKRNFWTLWCKGRLTEADTFHQFCEKPLHITFNTPCESWGSRTGLSHFQARWHTERRPFNASFPE